MAKNHLLYFGRTMPFTDRNGNGYEASFWILSNLNINTIRRELYIEFTAYRSIESFENEEPPIAADGGFWSKTFIGDAYDKLIVKHGQAVFSVVTTCTEISNSIMDSPNADASAFISFFDAATGIITE